MFTRIIVLTITLAFYGQTFGQSTKPPTPNAFDKATAISYALKQNADLRVIRKGIEIAEARLARTGLRPNPKIAVDFASDFAFNREGEHTTGLAFQQEFPLANRLRKTKAVSRVDIAKAKMEVRLHELEIANEISEIALEIQIVDTRRALLEKIYQKTSEISEFIQSRAKQGELSILEANQSILELRALEQEINHLSDQRTHLTHSLAPLLGLPSNEEAGFNTLQEIDTNSELPGFDSSIYERHPAFQLAVLDAHSAEAEIALAESENWESITAKVFLKNERSIDQPNGIGSDRFIGVGFSIPIPFRKKGDLRANEIRIERDQSNLKAAAVKQRIQHDIEHARHEAADFQKRTIEYRDNVIKLANEQLEATSAAYQKGQISLVSLLRAQEQLLRIERRHLDNQEAFARARLELERARIDLPQFQSANNL
jgi:cobalt-zinc-cadmium efflux system outer membrane protein